MEGADDLLDECLVFARDAGDIFVLGLEYQKIWTQSYMWKIEYQYATEVMVL